MRLLNSTTLKFKVFIDEQLPPYAILSHTWGLEEVSYQEQCFMHRLAALPTESRENEVLIAALEVAAGLEVSSSRGESICKRSGYFKIHHSARLARKWALDWFWVDTCCIDKSSSAELQEAINTMFRWYQNSAHCFVILEDVRLDAKCRNLEQDFWKMLRMSRWRTRGWTLQELIAPSVMTFYDANWTEITTKHKSLYTIHDVTGIPRDVLASGDLSHASEDVMGCGADNKSH
jgi:hypothetical protein